VETDEVRRFGATYTDGTQTAAPKSTAAELVFGVISLCRKNGATVQRKKLMRSIGARA